MSFELWPHQAKAIPDVLSAIGHGERRVCVTSPTGGGKSKIMEMLARDYLDRGQKVIAYTNRKMLVDQMSSNLMAAGVYHGIRAADYEDEREHNFQVSSIQTEHSRVMKKKTWELHAADLVLVDEAHIQKGDSVQKILAAHYEAGAAYVGFTATPLNIGDIYTHLVVAGNVSQLRECGALVKAVHYGPDEPDLKAFKKLKDGLDPTYSEQKKAMMTPSIMARVWEWFQKLNSSQKPTILFGPGVQESIWFAEQFCKMGVRAAHLDGDDVWLDGKFYKSDLAARAQLKAMAKAGEIKVVCNRFVLREGVDWPWIEHIIMAFIAGSLQTYLQTLGRGLRAAEGKTELVIQDHGGNWWRHGSINADREWSLDLTERMAYGLRAERLIAKKIEEPFRCPRCGRVWMKGNKCLEQWGGCGYVMGKRSRPVISTDGSLHEMTGDIFKERRISRDPNGAKIWEKMYYRSRTGKGKRTFNAARGLFAVENNLASPDPSWPFMPREEKDWYRLVEDVPRENLT